MRRCPDGVAATVGTARSRDFTKLAIGRCAHNGQNSMLREHVRISVASDDKKKGKGSRLQKPDCPQRSFLARRPDRAAEGCGSRRPVDVQSAVSRQKQSAYTETTAGSIVGVGRRGKARKRRTGALSWPK